MRAHLIKDPNGVIIGSLDVTALNQLRDLNSIRPNRNGCTFAVTRGVSVGRYGVTLYLYEGHTINAIATDL